MRYLPAEKLVGVEEGVVSYMFVDGDVIPRAPRALLQDATYLQSNGVLDRAYVVGTTNEESSKTGQDTTGYNTQDNLENLVQTSAQMYFPMTANQAVRDLIEFVYSYPRDADGNPSVKQMVNLKSDTEFVVPTVEFLTLLSATSPDTATFHYVFDHYPEVSTAPGVVTKLSGTLHSADLIFLFDNVGYPRTISSALS